MLTDGYDALRIGRTDLAKQIFETLRAAYPNASEARTATEELEILKGRDRQSIAPRAVGIPPARAVPSRPPAAEPEPAAGANDPDDHPYGYGDETGTAEAGRDGTDGDTGRDIGRDRAETPAGPVTAEQIRKARFRFLTEVGDRVFFAESSATIGGRARAILEAQARWIKAVNGLDVTIIGRAADGGNADDNAALSLARAKAVEAKLIEAGVPRERIRIEARGSKDPVATCEEAMCQAQNRHVESLLRLPGQPASFVTGEATDGAGAGKAPPGPGDSTRRAAIRALAR